MKKMMMTLLFLATGPLLLAAEVSKEDLKKLVAAGISDKVIVSFVQANGPVAKLTPEDLIELKTAGITEALLATVLSTPAPPARTAPVTRPSASNVYVTTPAAGPEYTYVDSYYSPSYYPYYPYYSYPYVGIGFGYYGGYYGGHYGCYPYYGYGHSHYGGHPSYGGSHGGHGVGGYTGGHGGHH